MLPDQYLLLSLADHQLASQEARDHGRPPSSYIRCLNAAGRWAVHGSTATPLLVWAPDQASAAAAAAERAAKARGRPVDVVTRGDADWAEGRQIQVFTEACEPALLGAAPLSAAKARRLRNEADKLEAFCLVVRAAAAAGDAAALSEVSRAAAQALRVRFGGGSVTSVFAWLAGKAGQQALESVLAGEVELNGSLSLADIGEAVELARQAERLREQHGATPGPTLH